MSIVNSKYIELIFSLKNVYLDDITKYNILVFIDSM